MVVCLEWPQCCRLHFQVMKHSVVEPNSINQSQTIKHLTGPQKETLHCQDLRANKCPQIDWKLYPDWVARPLE